MLLGGYLVTVEWVQHEILESPLKVYNFEVEEFHTYFVGECGVLVHNECITAWGAAHTKKNENRNEVG
ncbi:polymorphic toxin-type HINT domain-containing protein [Ruminococcus bicirculans (ex Wegman et al. 2014)]|uniref:polymorphic toxin-type HINT domain-containing protein n=1 Tax=Ruminococcus bicirculans (ex Wegman et al. 2014) TaxID=1160721 RepID=UPI00307C7653